MRLDEVESQLLERENSIKAHLLQLDSRKKAALSKLNKVSMKKAILNQDNLLATAKLIDKKAIYKDVNERTRAEVLEAQVILRPDFILLRYSFVLLL